MTKRVFTVKAIWDKDASVFYSESDIEGFHVEAPTVEEFEAIMFDVAAELIVANHISALEIAEKPFKELLPAIIWQRPNNAEAAA